MRDVFAGSPPLASVGRLGSTKRLGADTHTVGSDIPVFGTTAVAAAGEHTDEHAHHQGYRPMPPSNHQR